MADWLERAAGPGGITLSLVYLELVLAVTLLTSVLHFRRLKETRGELGAVRLYFLAVFGLFLVLPCALTFLTSARPLETLAGFGWTFGRAGLGLKLTLALLPLACLAGFSGSRDPGLRRMYPFAKEACSGTGRFVGYEVSYFIFYYLPWESVFRGVLFFPLVPAIGLIPALAVQTGAVDPHAHRASRQGGLRRRPLGPGLRTGRVCHRLILLPARHPRCGRDHHRQSGLPPSATGEGVRILVTGATGFVGAVLVPGLVARHGAGAVDAFVLPGDAIPATWRDSGVRLFRGDIADAAAVRAAVAGHDRVVHMAGLISYWKGDEESLRRVNEDGTRAVVEAALAGGVERLVHISSVGAIGFHEDGRPADETTAVQLARGHPLHGLEAARPGYRRTGRPRTGPAGRHPQSRLDHGPGRPQSARRRTTSSIEGYAAGPRSARSPEAWPSSTSGTSRPSSSRPSRAGAATARATSSSGPTSPTAMSSAGSLGPADAGPTRSPSRLPCCGRPGACSSASPASPGAGLCSRRPTGS